MEFDMLCEAIELASKAHYLTVDKQGQPYIFHPLRVMMHFRDDQEAQIVGVLHDVIEDSGFTLDDLREMGFSEPVITALDLLTHRKNQPYDEYLLRLKSNRLARMVKLADVKDNISRLPDLPLSESARLDKKYKKALEILDH